METTAPRNSQPARRDPGANVPSTSSFLMGPRPSTPHPPVPRPPFPPNPTLPYSSRLLMGTYYCTVPRNMHTTLALAATYYNYHHHHQIPPLF